MRVPFRQGIVKATPKFSSSCRQHRAADGMLWQKMMMMLTRL